MQNQGCGRDLIHQETRVVCLGAAAGPVPESEPHQPSPMAPPRFWWSAAQLQLPLQQLKGPKQTTFITDCFVLFFFSVSFVFLPLSKSELCDTLLQAAAPAHIRAPQVSKGFNRINIAKTASHQTKLLQLAG